MTDINNTTLRPLIWHDVSGMVVFIPGVHKSLNENQFARFKTSNFCKTHFELGHLEIAKKVASKVEKSVDAKVETEEKPKKKRGRKPKVKKTDGVW